MGEFYNLTKLRNSLLAKLDSLNFSSDIQGKIETLNSIITEHANSNNIDLVKKIKSDFVGISEGNQKLVDNINNTIKLLNQDIESYSRALMSDDAYCRTFSEEFMKQILPITPEVENWVKSKITQYSDWHYPALQINPRSKIWIDPMVASDPLYLTHINARLINDLIKDYPEIYQRRLRLYQIIDRNFSTLPQGQFGFVLCWDNFNYLSLDKIEKYIREVWKLLRPGGGFIFSYNNCDIESIALRIENQSGSYASTNWLIKLFNEIGYDIIAMRDDKTDDTFNTHVSWVEVKKPGNLKTVKAAQAMAQILSK